MSAHTTTQVQQSAPPALTPVQGVVLQRTCACGQHTIGGGECEACRQKRAARVQRAPRGSDPTGGLPGMTAPASSTARLGHDFSRVRVQAREAETAPPGLAISRPGDRHEQEAERAAAQVMDMFGAPAAQDTRGPVRLSRAAPSIQRAVAEAIDAPAAEADVAPAEAAAEESAAPETTPAPGLLVEDDAADAGPGQLRKGEFLAQLRAEICATTEGILAAVGRTSDGCPYLDSWFGYYGARSAQHLERAIRRYALETAGVSAARDYIPPIVGRIRRAVAVWAATGEVTGVPEGVSAEAPGAGAAVETEGGPAAAENVALKAREGGARSSMDPRAIRAQLGPGRALDSGVRAQMETAFGHDFSAVRVHMGARAADLSAGLNARAFTIGRDVAFGAGEYQPGTLMGDALIAHELAHVVQQGGASAAVAPMNVGDTGYNALEEDADLSAVGAMASLWGGAKGTLKDLAKNAVPRLRSGLRLSRCKTGTPAPTRSLSKKTVAGPTMGDCGEYSWTVQWLLDAASGTSGGHVIQTLSVEYNVTDCAGAAVNVHTEALQEAWPINPGQKVTKWAETGDVNDDTYTDPSSGKKTKGYIKVVATAAYYDGIVLPSDFKVNNPKTQSGILPSTDAIHTLTGGTAEIPHDLTVEWDCCPDKTDKTKVTKRS